MLALKYSLTPQQIAGLVGTERAREFQNRIAPENGPGLNDEQYGTLQQQAAERGMSPEDYINQLQLLAECQTVADPNNPDGPPIPTGNQILTPEQEEWLQVLRENNLVGEPQRTEQQEFEHQQSSNDIGCSDGARVPFRDPHRFA